jgi:hypothetical protein
MASWSEVDTHYCPCCGRPGVKKPFDFCYACMTKWLKVYRSCLNHGWDKEAAVKKADSSYPRKYSRDGVVLERDKLLV